MERWLVVVCSAVVFTIGCGDAAPEPDVGAEPAADGGTPFARESTGRAGAERAAGGRSGSARASAGVDDDAAVGGGFVIALSTSDCEGGCPVYDLKLDETGSVLFNGRGRVRQQGWGGKTVLQETAAEMLDLLVAAEYWKLKDVYREAADGCRDLEAGSATYIWNVTTDGPAKIVIDYQGCRGVSELDELRGIPDILIERLGLENWLTP